MGNGPTEKPLHFLADPDKGETAIPFTLVNIARQSILCFYLFFVFSECYMNFDDKIQAYVRER